MGIFCVALAFLELSVDQSGLELILIYGFKGVWQAVETF